MGSSILDMTGNNPCSRLPNSEFHTLSGLREWLHTITNEFNGEKGQRARNRLNSTGGLRSQVGGASDSVDSDNDDVTDEVPVTIRTCTVC